ncbi:LacI family transcriptional regulator [Caldibacillus lycopersici]|uniref:LacI family transcriptional regulator n=1 Tax=Perspicuibacillus lycopersici TaxID=1325689 RepID=A0AAE3LRP5_9BACI|nr:LacI family DNA-binding transcriptional regulator [Perspicuibacillus lycopersici]MCU9614889.1 LacI family transcriptional regulator [Perspicuibacillus lycopersici]
MKKNVTIKDVALAANVSIATVSRVINQNSSVNPEIKQRVLDAISMLNYYPNSAARSLKTHNTRTIAYLVSNISDYFFTTVGKGIEDVIKKYDYNLMLCNNANSEEVELAYIKLLQEKKVDGIILNTTGKNNELIAEISKDLPIVLSNRQVNHPDFRGDFIDFDNISGIYELTSHLISLGHRKIGIINGAIYLSTFRERFEGFAKAMKTIGVIVDNDYIYNYNGDGFSTFIDGYDGANYLMNLEEKPTAIVMTNSELAFGALKYFKSNNIRIPEDVSIVSFGDIVNRDILYVQPTITYTNLMGIGNKIGELMIERIEKNNQIINREIRFTTQIDYGNSTRKI